MKSKIDLDFSSYEAWSGQQPNFGGLKGKLSMALTSNELYSCLLQIEDNSHSLFQAFKFVEAGLYCATDYNWPKHSNDLSGVEIIDYLLVTADSDLKRFNFDKMLNNEPEKVKIFRILKGLAPTLAQTGIWLQHACRLQMAESLVGAKLLRQFAIYLGVVHDRLAQSEKAKLLLQECGIQLSSSLPHLYFEHLNLSESAREIALMDIAISFFPRSLLPELLGYNLWKACIAPKIHSNILQEFGKGLLVDSNESVQIAKDCLAEILANGSEVVSQKVISGFKLAHLSYVRFLTEIESETLSQLAAEIVLRQRKYMVGHHQNVYLKSISIDDWQKRPVEEFINALIESKWIAPGEPDNSKFMKLLDFSGPMFGIFSREEIDILHAWIRSLKSQSTGDANKKPPPMNFSLWNYGLKGLDAKTFDRSSAKFLNKINESRLFYYLVNYDLYPIIRPNALKRALAFKKQLAPPRSVPKYSAKLLEDLLKSRFDKEKTKYISWSKSIRPKISKLDTADKMEVAQDFIDSIVSTSPQDLTDGSWMVGSCDMSGARFSENRLLFKTFFEEMGEGNLKWNHLVLHRNLTSSMGHQIPALIDESIMKYFPKGTVYPIWTLLVGMFPGHLFPEALGINLAIEPFGVGGQYRIREELCDIFGFDGSISRVHNSVDNQSVGHSRLAVQAIQLFMNRCQANMDNISHNNMWRRIYAAYYAVDQHL